MIIELSVTDECRTINYNSINYVEFINDEIAIHCSNNKVYYHKVNEIMHYEYRDYNPIEAVGLL